MRSQMVLWYDTPAQEWFDGFPLGNGRLGAVVYGDPRAEQISLTESTFWSGEPSKEADVVEDGAQTVSEIRRLLAEDAYEEAERLSQSIIGRSNNYGTHLPFGNLRLLFDRGLGKGPDYRRELDLERGISRVSYSTGDRRFNREVFCSHADNVMVVHVAGDTRGSVNCLISMDGDEQPSSVEAGESNISMRVLARELVHSDGRTGVDGFARAEVSTKGGRIERRLNSIMVEAADELTIVLAAATSFGGQDPIATVDRWLENALGTDLDTLRERHVSDHSELFGRVELDLGPAPEDDPPMDVRLKRAQDGSRDNALYALLFQYGRYLLLSSSRSDSPLPAHLLGIWNDNVAARIGWSCDYHIDINIQMNYWIAEVAGLSECHLPLFEWIEQWLVPSGEHTARALYGCPGWVAHTVTNAWGFSAPGWSTWWGFFPTAGVWIASHLWNHYEFTGDVEFLRNRAYPILRSAALFFLEHLQEHPDTGWLVTGPACSPETGYLQDGKSYAIAVGPTVDRVLLEELFSYCGEAAKTLGVDAELARRVESARAALPPYQIGRHGQIQEWLYDYEEAEPHHRHTSHIMGVYPFEQITPKKTPELARAARTSIDRRISEEGGFEKVSWARNNLTLYYARFGDAEAAWQSLQILMTKVADRSLMVGPKVAPHSAYEMDYNTGASASIAEMLIQSHGGRLALLPALPSEWSAGSVRGLRARGGFVVDIEWSDGRLVEATIRSLHGRPCTLDAGIAVTVEDRAGSASASGDAVTVDFQTAEGEVYTVRPR